MLTALQRTELTRLPKGTSVKKGPHRGKVVGYVLGKRLPRGVFVAYPHLEVKVAIDRGRHIEVLTFDSRDLEVIGCPP